MSTSQFGGRALKKNVYELLASVDFDTALVELCRLPSRKVINSLFSFLYNKDEQIKWRAVTAFGAVVTKLADEDMEAARMIMRRLMWNLNDESGGIGWGSPEAMGEALACHEELAKEYARILLSYAREDGNYLEHEVLQRGLLWGIGRLSQVRPDLVKDAIPYLIPYLKSGDVYVRGLAAWSMGLIGASNARSGLEHLTRDEAEIQMYVDRKLIKRKVKELAEKALERLS
ncbi:MAG: HEAT repeat domain-containing protein [Desulfobacteraceae bacterium]|nr:MAG: HEAT repeat domain-containing protein [Desulfobacteraceae bacterium]